MNEARQLEARKAPSQKRSEKMVEKIHLATRELLANEGLEYLSTKRIAKQAGISPGSLYQYFPNKQAIVYAIYQGWLHNFNIAALESFNRRDQFHNHAEWINHSFRSIYKHALERSKTEIKVDKELHKALTLYPELEALEQQQAETAASALAEGARFFGSTWPEEKLNRLCLYLYEVAVTFETIYCHDQDDLEETMQWHMEVITAGMNICMPDESLTSS